MSTSIVLALSALLLLYSNKISLNAVKRIDKLYLNENIRNIYGKLIGEIGM